MSADAPHPNVLHATFLFARLALLQLVRGRVLWLGAASAAFGLALAALASQGAVAYRGRIVADFVLASSYLTGCATAVAATIAVVASASARSLAAPWLTRAVPRWCLLVGQLLGIWALLAALSVSMGLTGAATCWAFGGAVAQGYAAAVGLHFVAFGALASFTALASTVCAVPLAAAAAVAALAAGNAGADLLALAQSPEASPAMVGLVHVVHALLPDFAALSLRDYVAANVAPPWAHVAAGAAYGLAYSAAATVLAAVVDQGRQTP